ncbi:hypothetical protein D1631_11290 [Chryseobacterium nematophagum]|uniref:Uncharacterized protein n=1 Tax=Chryseobacterium nematophagum TaxID=2305228 RepID=A0A3M7TG43_9FLAO|nr:hypothetical protein [Chryseobacterium nematophagum]RNA62475.1 hypothetical protein D1631_11290 [Chryseobacterium nematophagum]
MKKILAIIFSIFYFGFSSGAIFSVHYCMNNLSSISQKCGVKDKNGCCKTEFKIFKVDDFQKSELFKTNFLQFVQENNEKYDFLLLDRSFSASKYIRISINGPPEKKSIPIYIHHCNFRI